MSGRSSAQSAAPALLPSDSGARAAQSALKPCPRWDRECSTRSLLPPEAQGAEEAEGGGPHMTPFWRGVLHGSTAVVFGVLLALIYGQAVT